MSHTVTFKLNKPAHQFTTKDGFGFGIRGGVKYYDFDTKKDEWTNYECALFSKVQAQTDYYAKMLAEGAVVSVSGESLKVKPFTNQQGQTTISLSLNNARLEYVVQPIPRAPDAAQQAYSQGVAPRAVPPAPAGFDSFDDDIPFS